MTEGHAGAVAENLPSVAQRADELHAIPDRVTTLRFFTGHVHRLAMLAMVETGVVFLAVYAAFIVRFPNEGLAALEASSGPIWTRASLTAGVVLVCLYSMGLYQLHKRANITGVLARVIIALAAAFASLLVLSNVMPSVAMGWGVLLGASTFSFAGLTIVRSAFLRLVDDDIFKRRVLVWGAGTKASNIANRLRRRTDQRGFKILGYVAAPGDEVSIPAADILHREHDLLQYVLSHRVEEIVVAMDDRRRGFPEAFLRECRLRGIVVRDIVCFLEAESGRVSVELAQPSCLIYSMGFRTSLARLVAKRLFDLCVSVVVLVAAAPIALLAAAAIFLEDRGPIFYRQVRTGKDGRPFNMLKFRSMSVNAEANGQAVWAGQNDSRTTRVGAFIRTVRIDELPQVINVLVGDMSFVGPRPERPQFVESLSKVIPFYPERHFVKPGITGWAQLRYRYGASEADAREKLGYDLYYVTKHSLAFDLMVLLQTVEVVLLRIGGR